MSWTNNRPERRVRSAKAALTAGVLAAWLLAASPVVAGAYEEYRSISRTLEEKPATAKEAVDRFEKRWERGTPSERTMAAYLRLRVSLYLTDFPRALKATEKLLALNPDREQKAGLFKLGAQLSYQTEGWKDVLPYVERWESVAGSAAKTGETYAEMASLAAYALWQQEKVKASVPWMRRAFDASPREERGTFLLAAWQKLGDEKAQLDFLPTMVKLYGRPRYWGQWGYLTYEAGEPKKALDILSAADKAGRLPPTLYPLLVDLEMREGAATKAVSVLVGHPRHFEPGVYRALLIAAYLKAGDREKALDASLAILKNEGRRAGAGTMPGANEELAARLAFSEEKWALAYEKTAALAERDRDDAKKADLWRFMAGVAAYEQKDWAKARGMFGAVTDKKLKKGAEAWIEQINFLAD